MSEIKRFAILGLPGSGKSTFAIALQSIFLLKKPRIQCNFKHFPSKQKELLDKSCH